MKSVARTHLCEQSAGSGLIWAKPLRVSLIREAFELNESSFRLN